jgi:response regulator RpfG family c-di-GMP phosphodiesterase
MKIILTGYTDIDALVEAINTARIYRFICKPWDPTALKQVVQDAFREHEKFMQQKQLLDTLAALVRSCPALFEFEDDNGGQGNDIASETAPCNLSAEPVN